MDNQEIVGRPCECGKDCGLVARLTREQDERFRQKYWVVTAYNCSTDLPSDYIMREYGEGFTAFETLESGMYELADRKKGKK